METIVVEDHTSSSIQDDNDNIIIPNDSFYKLLEKHTKEYEEIGKKMLLNLQNSFKEYVDNLETVNPPMENFHKNFDGDFISQSKLIDSLKARIEELEIESIVRDQDIKELRHEFNDLIRSIPTQNKKVTTSTTTLLKPLI